MLTGSVVFITVIVGIAVLVGVPCLLHRITGMTLSDALILVFFCAIIFAVLGIISYQCITHWNEVVIKLGV